MFAFWTFKCELTNPKEHDLSIYLANYDSGVFAPGKGEEPICGRTVICGNLDPISKYISQNVIFTARRV